MPSFCVVSTCDNRFSPEEHISFHKFPRKNLTLLKEWITFANKGVKWKPTKWSSICSRHFKTDDFKEFLSRKMLKKDVVPCISIQKNSIMSENSLKLPILYESNLDSIKNLEDNLCRLCANSFSKSNCLKNYININLDNIPCLSIRPDDLLPKKICIFCIKRVQQFDSFIDRIIKVQLLLEKKFNNKINSKFEIIQDVQKQIKIKQEPITVIKEEILEPRCKIDFEELYDHNLDCIQTSSEDNLNNEVMEIIQHENVINITEDILQSNANEFLGMNVNEMKVERKPIIYYDEERIELEHNYCKNILGNCKIETTNHLKFDNTNNENNSLIETEENNLIIPVCKICNCKFEFMFELKKHTDLMHLNIKRNCYKCLIECNTLYDYLIHKNICVNKTETVLPIIDKSIKCLNCNQILKNKLSFNNHKKYICPLRKPPTFQCSSCNKLFDTKILLLKHASKHVKIHQEQTLRNENIKRKINTKKSSKRKTFTKINGKFPCDICSRTYGRHSNLLSHMRRHRPREEWNIKCKDCGMIFDKCYDLHLHCKIGTCSKQQNIIENKKIFVCVLCGRQLKSSYSLKIHEMTNCTKIVRQTNI